MSENKSPERKFYHDMANLLAIAKGMSELALHYVANPDAADVKKCKDKLEKAVASLERMETTMKDYRRANPVQSPAAKVEGSSG